MSGHKSESIGLGVKSGGGGGWQGVRPLSVRHLVNQTIPGGPPHVFIYLIHMAGCVRYIFPFIWKSLGQEDTAFIVTILITRHEATFPLLLHVFVAHFDFDCSWSCADAWLVYGDVTWLGSDSIVSKGLDRPLCSGQGVQIKRICPPNSDLSPSIQVAGRAQW